MATVPKGGVTEKATSAAKAEADPGNPLLRAVLVVGFSGKTGPGGIDRFRRQMKIRKGILHGDTPNASKRHLADPALDIAVIVIDGRQGARKNARKNQVEFIEYVRTSFPEIQLVTAGYPVKGNDDQPFTICKEHVNAGCATAICWDDLPSFVADHCGKPPS